MRMRLTVLALVLVLALALALLGGGAHAQALLLNGKFGYLGEYEFSAQVAADAGQAELSGPLTVRHVGLCTHNGPSEVSGQIKLRIAQVSSRVNATLLFDGHRCSFSGTLSQSSIGEMICADAAVPISLWSAGQ